MNVKPRKRGTAIVETSKGILVVSGRKMTFLLPGGGTHKGETRMAKDRKIDTKLINLNIFY